ncbi:IS4 family transposase ISPa45 [Sporomusa silvacetica DSM 10669]|uniref:IS4 family transposase ISPa45 n=1 Tax=Sporomusa silvacetica DSM 10669 TaxID=1123289 RepID=A0ABZ3IPR1_9FIRM|nr:transposase DDE domain protein [Sporomusa silvacetica DSM 10669]
MMLKKFMTSLEIAREQINDSLFMLTNRTKSTYFTKDTAKMNFKDAIYFILKGLRKTLQIEIDDWFEFLGGEDTMTKQAFSQLRQKIKPDAFIQLNEKYINWFYSDDDFNKYKGYRLLSIDGSITEIPNTVNTREHFGYYHNQSDRKQARAMVCVIYDIENDIILESDIRTWKAAERDVAKYLIERLELNGFQNDLFLFDRGYPSKDMFDFLESKQLKYLMRVKVNKFHPEFDRANNPDQLITLIHKNKTLTVRIINVILPTGEVEKLVTNIMNVDLTTDDFKVLYFKRWGIEVKYSQLKSRYELENFSGVNPIAIMQDFYATIYLSNIMTMAKAEANETAKLNKEGLKYEYKVNMNILISKMTKTLIECFYEDDPKKRTILFDKTMSNITKNLVPVRPDRSFPRREPSRKNKYPINKKRSV